MLKWIGMEEGLLYLEMQQEYLQNFLERIEKAGIQKVILKDDAYNRVTASEGLLILNGANTCYEETIGNMPVIGYDNRCQTASMVEGIRYVIESFEGIDVAYLQMVYHRYYKLPITIARTKRGILKEITEEDISTLWDIGISIRSRDGLLVEGVTLKEEMEFAKGYIANMYHFYNYGMWSFRDKNSIFGIAGLDNIDVEALPEGSRTRAYVQAQFCLQAGYHICYNFRGRGYGFEALCAVARYGLENIGADMVFLLIEPHNRPSSRLAHKAGFIYVENTTYEGKTVEVYKSI